MTEKLIRHVSRFAAMKTVVLGDVMLDIYEYCFTAQSRPIDSEKPGKRAYAAQALTKTPGGAGNVAANLSALGVSPVLIGVTGNDGYHLTLQQLAEQHGIRARLFRDPDRPTTTKNRLYLDGEYQLRRDNESTRAIPGNITDTLIHEVECELDGADAVILSDYNKGVFSESMGQQIIGLCRVRDIPVIVDFKPSNRRCFHGADIMAPNASEAEALLPGFNTSSHLEPSVRRLHGYLQCRRVVVTLGSRGICGFDGDQFFYIPAVPVAECDAVGCGDTVRAVLSLGHASGLSLAESATLANAAAGLVVQKTGTATVTRDELVAFLRSV